MVMMLAAQSVASKSSGAGTSAELADYSSIRKKQREPSPANGQRRITKNDGKTH